MARVLKCSYETLTAHHDQLSSPGLVMHLMHVMKGAYAILLRFIAFPNEFLACKVGSALVLGLKPANRGETFVTKSYIRDHGLHLHEEPNRGR